MVQILCPLIRIASDCTRTVGLSDLDQSHGIRDTTETLPKVPPIRSAPPEQKTSDQTPEFP